MKKFIAGLIVGIVLGGGIAWAASSIRWVDNSGVLVGTSSNPVYVQTN